MFEISVQASFSAAHRVRGYKGDCAGLHGHTYRVEVCFNIKKLNQLGMALDFRKAKKVLQQIVTKLDHKNINSLPFFKKHNATAEWIAVYIFKEMQGKINNVKCITVWEGSENAVSYYE